MSHPGHPWIRPPKPSARFRLYGFPFAGGGSTDFRALVPDLPADLDLVPILLPGREARLGEAPIAAIEPLVAALADALTPALRERPFGFYGHSMGSWVAFELTRHLRRLRRPLPQVLIVAARHAPHLPDERPKLAHLPDGPFIAGIEERYGPLPALIRNDPALLALFLPALRADFGLLDGYVYRDEDPLPVPIEAWRGESDGVTSRASAAAWASHTSTTFAHHVLPGGHFFLKDARDAAVDQLTTSLRRHLDAARG